MFSTEQEFFCTMGLFVCEMDACSFFSSPFRSMGSPVWLRVDFLRLSSEPAHSIAALFTTTLPQHLCTFLFLEHVTIWAFAAHMSIGILDMNEDWNFTFRVEESKGMLWFP